MKRNRCFLHRFVYSFILWYFGHFCIMSHVICHFTSACIIIKKNIYTNLMIASKNVSWSGFKLRIFFVMPLRLNRDISKYLFFLPGDILFPLLFSGGPLLLSQFYNEGILVPTSTNFAPNTNPKQNC